MQYRAAAHGPGAKYLPHRTRGGMQLRSSDAGRTASAILIWPQRGHAPTNPRTGQHTVNGCMVLIIASQQNRFCHGPADFPLPGQLRKRPRLPARSQAAGLARLPDHLAEPEGHSAVAARKHRRHLLHAGPGQELEPQRYACWPSATWPARKRSTGWWRWTISTWRWPPRCASICAFRAWARPPRAIFATSWPCACKPWRPACACPSSCTC